LRLASIETRAYRLPLDPPFLAAWDPVPRTHLDATLTIVTADDGSAGYASGDALPDRALLERHLGDLNLPDPQAVYEVCRTVDFHSGRPWTCEVAVWDLVGRAAGEPVWRMLGGRNDALTAYASTAERVEPDERVRRAVALRDAGWRAVKLRVGAERPGDAAEAVGAVRAAVGPEMTIMVDVNQGWRMPGDRTPPWDVRAAAELARALDPLDVYWIEEPLPCADVDGYAELRRATRIRIAAGEMVRTEHEARDLVVRGGVDVIQCDVVLAGGIEGCRRIAELAEAHGASWSPHTWSHGHGLIANLHAALALSTCPFLEVPYDPPGWTPERRDFPLPAPVEVHDGLLERPPGAGLGTEPDLEAIEPWRVA
jgi:L-alanine-DL-glutamate epimerase-like enolase superfamily enzyme